jgi:glycosyltransferase involved in cell wall biosynthesis
MEKPGISVIIASYNEQKFIGSCIESLLKQTYDGQIEIIIGDGGSADDTIEIIREYLKTNSNIILLNNEYQFQAFGRNIGIEKATHNLIAYIDAHSYASENWLEELYKSFILLKEKDERFAGVGSVYEDARNTSFSKAAFSAITSIFSGATKNIYLNKHDLSKVDNAYACLYDKEILLKAGLYDTDFQVAEDMELNQRLTVKLGYNLYVNPNATVYYYRKGGIMDLFYQQFRYGFWRMKLTKKQGKVNPKVLAPGIFVLSLLALLLISRLIPAAFLIFSIVFLSYILIMLLGSLVISIKRGCNFFWLLLIFLHIHFGYGFGVLCGFVYWSRD